MGEREPPHPGPLLHKCVEEREKAREVALHQPAVEEFVLPLNLLLRGAFYWM